MRKYLNALLATALFAFLSGARAEASGKWIGIAVETLHEARVVPETADRHLTLVSQAIARALADTLSCGEHGDNRHGDPVAQRERRDAAVAVAAFAVLESLYPERREDLEARLALAFSYIPETPAKAEGAALGRRVARQTVAAARWHLGATC